MTLKHAGCALHYTVAGNGAPIVFIQGVGVHGDAWLPQTRELAESFSCLTCDNRGMAASQPMGDRFSIEQMADDTLAIMDHAGWKSAHLVGHSMGGLIALQTALLARQRVLSLSLLCTFANGRVAAAFTPWAAWMGLRGAVGPLKWRRRAFLEMVMSKQALAGIDRDRYADELAIVFGHDLAKQPPIAMKQLMAMRKCDLTPRLSELAGLSTLVVSCAHDRIAPPSAGRDIAAGISGAAFIKLPEAAHGVTIHQPATINRLLIDHIKKSEGN